MFSSMSQLVEVVFTSPVEFVICVFWQNPKINFPKRRKPLRNFPLLALSLSLFLAVPLSLWFALQADRFVRLKGSAQTALVVSANNGKDMMAFRDKQRYLAEDVLLTCACINRRAHTHTHTPRKERE